MQYQSAPRESLSKICSIDALPVKLQLKQLWWVEVRTSVPLCTYYFGPFNHQHEARVARSGYVEDLREEGARDIVAIVKQCDQPDVLTVDRGYYSAVDPADHRPMATRT
jgi:hypothetical protein